MKNESFYDLTPSQRYKKLEVALRKLTGDRLTETERRMICDAVGFDQQYSLQICESPDGFRKSLTTDNGVPRIRTIFGSPGNQSDTPTAVLVYRPDGPVVYIYLPEGEGVVPNDV